MSRIDDLIAELCPDGVPYKPLGEVGVFARGNGLQKSDLTDEGLPAVHYGQVHTYYGVSTDTTKSFTTPNLYARLRHAKPGDLIIATTSEDTEAVGKATAWIGEGEVAVSGDAYVFSHSMESKFVSYFFNSRSFHEQKLRFVTGAKVRRISGDAMAKIIIPVPPLEVQREIVRVLDQFTQLEAELEAELEARRRQFEYVRHRHLAFESSVPTVSLGEIALVQTGQPISKKTIEDSPGPYPVINSGRDPLGFYSRWNVDDDPIGITSRGAGVGSVTWCPGRYYRGNLNYSVSVRDERFVDSRFLYFSLRHLQAEIQKLCSFQGIPALNRGNLVKLRLPMPDLGRQLEIADALNMFETLTSDLFVGLPAELAARRKQYEYYRDKLLKFERVA